MQRQNSNGFAPRTDKNHAIRGNAFSVTVKSYLSEGQVQVPNIQLIGNKILAYAKQQDDVKVKKIIGQIEEGEETGRVHAQVFIEFQDVHSAPRVMNLLRAALGHEHIFLKVCTSGSSLKMQAYACKDETRSAQAGAGPFIYDGGESLRMERMTQDDIDSLRNAIAEHDASKGSESKRVSERALILREIASGNMTLAGVQGMYPEQWAQWARQFRDCRSAYLSSLPIERNEKSVMVLWGRAGTGKTYSVTKFMEYHGLTHQDVFYVKTSPNGRLWFDGYDGQKVLAFDDFEGNAEVQDFLHMCDYDAQSHLFEVKFGKVRLFHQLVLFTSNSNPDYWYKDLPMSKQEAVARRIKLRVKFTEEKNPEEVALKMTKHIFEENPQAFKACKLKSPIKAENNNIQPVLKAPALTRSPAGFHPAVDLSEAALAQKLREHTSALRKKIIAEWEKAQNELNTEQEIAPRVKRERTAQAPTIDLTLSSDSDEDTVEIKQPLARKPPSIKLERIDKSNARRDNTTTSLAPTQPVPWLEETETELDSDYSSSLDSMVVTDSEEEEEDDN